ncbi:diguanylate cyclase [Desulforhopalus vacuolatus]|uniref:diguanylate cyclase domain-containing protein n=1 Tax=Desulforhopalus vacuolatus TaxID=40414 RepID=UPI0019637406|nr:diguanylate cyclase [Desulforhopalus vacuolatus]MBM9520578.1 diguanylate cyclase [Desulforhopalus vacuolatus]
MKKNIFTFIFQSPDSEVEEGAGGVERHKVNRIRWGFLFVITLLWFLFIYILFYWNLSRSREFHIGENVRAARSFFEMVVVARRWNAEQGGVYVPVTDKLQPNPWLKDPLRDVVTRGGMELTMINPAFMTRLISEDSSTSKLVDFHITSLKPLRPGNAARAWEKDPLKDFERKKIKEYWYVDDTRERFHYIAPLYTEESCLDCHREQGYKVGDIRGGISVNFHIPEQRIWPLAVNMLLVGGVGAAIILFFGRQLIRSFDTVEKLAEVDSLTKLANRRRFSLTFHREFSLARRNGTSLSMILCDIDYFKPYNDNYGHPEGDNCLRHVARALAEEIKRPGDLLARYGGEEFIVILPETSAEGCRRVAELLREKVEQQHIPHEFGAGSPWLTMSFGCSTFCDEDISEEEFLNRVDQALYRAKEKGRNRVEG